MRSTSLAFGAVLNGTHAVLPWLIVLAFASALALAVTIGLADHAGSSANAFTSCDTSGHRLQYVGLNSWIPAEPSVTPCPVGGS